MHLSRIIQTLAARDIRDGESIGAPNAGSRGVVQGACVDDLLFHALARYFAENTRQPKPDVFL